MVRVCCPSRCVYAEAEEDEWRQYSLVDTLELELASCSCAHLGSELGQASDSSAIYLSSKFGCIPHTNLFSNVIGQYALDVPVGFLDGLSVIVVAVNDFQSAWISHSIASLSDMMDPRLAYWELPHAMH